jgi:ribosome-associated heat shock protein Hsp15
LDRQRIDKWLWHARVVRTRTAAAGLVDGGLVRINATRTDAASRAVRAGDVVTVALDRIRVLRVTGFSERRGSATEAASLFEDLSPAMPAASSEQGEPDAGSTRRPSKQERRALLRLKRPGNG